MRKIFAFAMSAAVAVSCVSLASCGKKHAEGRTQYTITAEYFEETRTLSAEMTVSVKNHTMSAIDELKFQLWANAYREGAKYAPVSELFSRAAYYNGKSYGEMKIKGISGADSFSVGGEDANILTLKLKSPLEVGKRTEVTVNFEVALANVKHRLGYTQHTVNLGGFYPVLCYIGENGFEEYVYSSNGDPFVSEIADYDVTLTVPETYVLGSGFSAEELADENPDDGKRPYHVRAEGVRDVAFVLGKDFQVLTDTVDDKEVAYYYYADTSPETALKAAKESLAFYSETFGEYEYPRYAVVEADFVYGGMEYPALSMIASDLRTAERPTVVAHETAHQWWYSMVGSNQFEHAWQDEGLAEYSTALFFEAHPEYNVKYSEFIEGCERSYRAFFSVYSQVHGEADTTMSRPLTKFSGEYEYRNIAYDKGVILFDRVRDVAGARKFNAALKRYASTYSGTVATPAQLIGCFSKAGVNVAGLFDSFTKGLCVI